jgi:hypothetical protein
MNVSITNRLRLPTHPSHHVPEEKLERNVKVSLTTPWRRGCRGLPPFILKLDTRCGWVVNSTALPLYSRERNPVHTEQKIVWALEPVWATWKREKLRFFAGIQPPDRPDRKLDTIPTTVQRLYYLDQNTENVHFLACLRLTDPEDAGIITLRNVVDYSPVIITALYNP